MYFTIVKNFLTTFRILYNRKKNIKEKNTRIRFLRITHEKPRALAFNNVTSSD